jgi:hypothetical protein
VARKISQSKQLQITLEGPFFERDPRRTFRQNVRDMMAAIAKEAEASVKADIASHAGRMPHYTGHSHDAIVGRTRSVTGRRWEVSAVISASTQGMGRREAIRTKAAAASIERRWHPFRRTAGAIRRSRAVLATNLTKGLE